MDRGGRDSHLPPAGRPTRTRCSWRSGSIRAAAAGSIRCRLSIASPKTKTDRTWKAVWLENEYLGVMILPEIGGRIHVGPGQDQRLRLHLPPARDQAGAGRTGRAVDLRRHRVQLAAAPPARRPSCRSTCTSRNMPDGSATVWLSDHDPMARMKGMHGVCLHPGPRVHRAEGARLQPHAAGPDFPLVGQCRDAGPRRLPVVLPARRRLRGRSRQAGDEPISALRRPLLRRRLRGARPRRRAAGRAADEVRAAALRRWASTGRALAYAANDLSWYANIPVPTSYMCMGSQEDFFGGYDHCRTGGHRPRRQPSHRAGQEAMDLGQPRVRLRLGPQPDATSDGPYIELMAGVYTDNQPDFSFLQPGETKNLEPVLVSDPEDRPGATCQPRCGGQPRVRAGKRFRIGVSVTAPRPGAVVRLESPNRRRGMGGRSRCRAIRSFWKGRRTCLGKLGETLLRVLDEDGRELIAYKPAAADARGSSAAGQRAAAARET